MNYLKKRWSALGFALSGLTQAFKNEVHLKLHGLATLFVVNAGVYFHVSVIEWFMLGSVIALVICLELMNSALEKLCDKLVPELDLKIKYVKDVAAGAVLLASVFALIVGVMVFLPYLI